jgi:hypothetical protein
MSLHICKKGDIIKIYLGDTQMDKDIDKTEKDWDLKAEAHNNIFNYLKSKGLEEDELLYFLELLKEYSRRVIEVKIF